jgi:Xaa-Pro aminopeptidase
MTITIEPGVYLEGFGGVRIEDTVVVTKSGCEILTPTSKELREL